MSKIKTFLAVHVLLVFVVVSIFIILKDSKNSAPHESLNPYANATSTAIATTTAENYTLEEVATHNSKTNCWSTINGKVYDLSAWIDQHPGGAEAIISLCGIDGSAAFNDQHGGQRRPANELAGFLIGDLK